MEMRCYQSLPRFLRTLIGVLGFSFAYLALAPSPLAAASYDYYVRAGEDGDGSEDDPFGSIQDAVDEVGDDKGKRIFVREGSYSASLTVPKGTTIVGEDAKEVTVTGLLTLSDDVELEQLGFTGGGSLLIAKNSHVVLEKLRFKDIVGTAIKSDPGSAEVVIRDTLIEKARKGMYLQAGTTLQAEDLEVVNNLEEGVDIRENVNGSIKGSVFRDNDESGVEIVLGSSNFSLTGNTFSGNGASGVAAQFYIGAKKLGSVKITGNTFSKNDWGVDCKAPQGKMESKFYFLNSLTIENNTYKDNRDGEIASRCKIMTDEERIAYEAEEAKRKQAEEDRVAALSLSEAAVADRMAKAIAERREYEEGESKREAEALQATLTELEGALQRLDERVRAWQDRGALACLIVGPDVRTQMALERSLPLASALVERLQSERERLRFEANRVQAETALGQAAEILSAFEAGQSSAPCGFSLFGWANRFLAERSEALLLLADALRDRPLAASPREPKLLYLGELNYYPKVREAVVRGSDALFFGGVRDELRRYASVGAYLPLPILSELDPLPAVSVKTPLSFPFRFASLFASANIDFMQLAANRAYTGNPDAYRKTVTQLDFAGIDPVGTPETLAPRAVWLGEHKVMLITYREGVAGALASVEQSLREAKQPTIVLVAWSEARAAYDAERKQQLEKLVQAGADLIIGHGLPLKKTVETLSGVPAYVSLGSVWRDFEQGDPAGSESVALEIGLSEERFVVTEKKLRFTATEGLRYSE